MKYILIILFAFTVNAQDVWYVSKADEPTRTTYDGTSWATAWSTLSSSNFTSQGVDYSDLSAGDTIYVSGGTDSSLYIPPSGIYSTRIEPASHITFASGSPIVIAPASASGRTTGDWANHIGEVWIGARDNTTDWVFEIHGISNIKVTGFNFIDNRTNDVSTMIYLGDPGYGGYDSLITINNCRVLGRKFGANIYLSGYKTTVENSFFYQPPVVEPRGNDPLGMAGGWGGHTIRNNLFVMQNAWEVVPPGTSTNITSTSLTDTSLNMVTDYHVGGNIFVDGYYIIITGNTSDTFTASGGWQFETIERTSSVTITSTSMNHGTENFEANAYINCYLIIGGDSLKITSNGGYDFNGTAGWFPSTPSSGTHTWRLVGGDTPISGRTYIMGGSHYDGLQISNFDNSTSRWTYNYIYNNLIIDKQPLGTNWNGMIYSSMGLNGAFYIYNNIIVSQKPNTSITGIWVNKNIDYDSTIVQSAHILNNTIILKGNGSESGAIGINEGYNDTLIIKNNLIVIDSTNRIFIAGGIRTRADVYEVDYNAYISSSDIEGIRFPDVGYGAEFWSDWLSGGLDAHTILGIPDTVSFSNKYDTLATGYYTETGRDLGTDLSSDYPFLSTDILGNPRTGAWDIGALEYQDGAVDTVPTFSFTPVTGATRNGYYTVSSVFTNADSTFHVWTATNDSFKVGALSNYDLTMVTADSGDTVFVSNIASGSFNTANVNYVVAGGNSQGFSVTTVDIDSLPDAFTFTDITSATRSTPYTSNLVTFTTFDSAYAYAGGAEYQINSGSWVTGYTKVFNNDNARVRLTSSGSYSDPTDVTLTVGSRSDIYTVTTEAEPTPSSGTKVFNVTNGVFRTSNGKVIRTQ